MIKNKIIVFESIATWLDVDTGMMGDVSRYDELIEDGSYHITEADTYEIHHNISSYEKPIFDFFKSYLPLA